MDLSGSVNLKEIPDLSKASNLEELVLSNCSSLVELPSSIQYLNKLENLNMTCCENLETLPTGINLKSLFDLDLSGCSRLKIFPDISTNISMLNLGETGIEEYPSNLRLENLSYLDMYKLKSWKRWKILQPLKPLLNILSPSLRELELSDIPSLVKLPSSIQKFNELFCLRITDCVNLETLPTGINLEFLHILDLSGSSRLRTFPYISTAITTLTLNETGIEEVPWWIQDFSNLRELNMRGCNNLLRVSLNLFKLKFLVHGDFSYCGALSVARWDDICTSSPGPELILINCFNLDQEALLQQHSVFFKSIRLSGEEVPSYFTHRTTTGTSLTNIPLLKTSLSKSSFRFKACTMVFAEPMFFSILDSIMSIQVSCRFIDVLGNHFDSADLTLHVNEIKHPGSHVVVFDCQFLINRERLHLPEVNYDHVDIQFHLTAYKCDIKLTGCGITISEDDGNSKEYEDCDDSGFGNEIDHGEEYEDCNDSGFGNEIDDSGEYEDCVPKKKKRRV